MMANKKKLLITGGSGFLGWNLCRAAADRYRVMAVSHSRPVAASRAAAYRCDLTDPRAVSELFQSAEPDAVIHCAAMVNPNECQERPADSHRINVEASIFVARECGTLGIPCMFVSTDLLFDGRNPPYNEESEPCPISTYGEHKLMTETGMRAQCPDLLVCRVPLMYGDVPPGASSFIQPMIAALRLGKEIALFTDEFRTPASGASVAQGILLGLETTRGTLHLGGRERISRYDFGKKLAAALGIEQPNIRGVLQRDAVMIAPRPPDVSFDSSKAFALGYAPRSIDEELAGLSCIQKNRNAD